MFGCDVYEHVDQAKVPGGQKARKGYFMGVPADSPAGFLMYDIHTGTIRTVFSATFDESMVRRRCNIRVYDKAREIFTLQRQGLLQEQAKEVVEELVFGEPDDQLTFGIIRRHFNDEQECEMGGEDHHGRDKASLDAPDESNEHRPVSTDTLSKKSKGEKKKGGKALMSTEEAK